MDSAIQYQCFVGWKSLITTGRVSTDKYDERTNFYCRDDGMDIKSYIRYVELCANLRRVVKSRELTIDEGKHRATVSGPDYMFDLGFLPITMTPSYWPQDFANDAIKAMQNHRIQAFPRPAIGLATYHRAAQRTGAAPEWWVSKVDVARVLGKDPLSINLAEVFSLCG